MRLEEHLESYGIRRFRDQNEHDRWVVEYLGRSRKRRFDRVLRSFDERGCSRESSSQLFDELAEPGLAGAFWSRTSPWIRQAAEGIGALIEGRRRVLDLGCHVGHLTTWFARLDPARVVTGVDLSEKAVAAARRMARKLGVANARFEARDLARCDLTDTYDAVIDLRTLRYLPNSDAFLRHLATRLIPGGVFVTAVNQGPGARPLLDLLGSCGLAPQSLALRAFLDFDRPDGVALLTAEAGAAPCPIDLARAWEQADLTAALMSLGLGCAVERRSLRVTEVVPGSPVARAGASPGQRLLAVDGVPVEAVSSAVVREKIRRGQPVALEVVRGD